MIAAASVPGGRPRKPRRIALALAGLSALIMPYPAGAASPPAASGRAGIDQAQLDRFAAELQIRYTVIDNHPAGCPSSECFLSRLELVAPHGQPSGDWSLYFSMEAAIDTVGTDQVAIRHVDGDLYEMRPTAGFAGFAPGRLLAIDLRSEGTQLSRFFMMPNQYLASGKLEPRVIGSTRPVVDRETGLESDPFVTPFADEARLAGRSARDDTRWPTAAGLYADNAAHAENGGRGDPPARAPATILPTPLSLRLDAGGRRLGLAGGIALATHGLPEPQISAAIAALAEAGVARRRGGVSVRVALEPMPGQPAGAYRVSIAPTGIRIGAIDAEGASDALYSLVDLLAADRSLPVATIEDAPRFAYRGLLIDVSRNFHGKPEMLKILDQMARYKLNRLHLHLADDQGWRLEIPGLPELTRLGSVRCHDPAETRCLIPQLGSGPSADAPVNGHFTRRDYIDIVRAAQARHIQVIPSLDMPGHSRAAIRAMEARSAYFAARGDARAADRYRLADPADRTVYRTVQGFSDNVINVCLESSYRFEQKVIDEVARMHAAAGQPLTRYFIGGDEVPGAWSASPACADLARRTGGPLDRVGSRFLERIAASLARRGIVPAAWSDGMADVDPAALPRAVQSDSWETLFDSGVATTHHQANRPGWQVVLSTPDATYFDMPYSPDPDERGNGWATRNLETRKAFEFMPANLPAHAEIWKDGNGRAAPILDSEPLRPGVRFGGIQAQLWSEMVHSDAQVDYLLFPRLIAFAERAWHRAGWEVPYDPAGGRHDPAAGRFSPAMAAARDADWGGFATQLGERELPRLDRAGIRYRIPVPGGRIVGGRLEANLSIPGLPIEYRANGGAWTAYPGAIAVDGPVDLRARSADGLRAGRSIRVDP